MKKMEMHSTNLQQNKQNYLSVSTAITVSN
jgi:hypothetical protein